MHQVYNALFDTSLPCTQLKHITILLPTFDCPHAVTTPMPTTTPRSPVTMATTTPATPFIGSGSGSGDGDLEDDDGIDDWQQIQIIE